MKRKITYCIKAGKAICFLLLLCNFHSKAQNVTATINTGKTNDPIQPYFYGMFTELLSNMYEKGMWSEMLSDRKFFYPVNSSERLVPQNTKRNFNRWRLIGGDEVVTMDTKKAYVGKHSPEVKLTSSPQGIQQTGMAFRKGKKYTGYIILAASPGAKVKVSLVWGTNAGDRQTISLNTLTANYVKYPLTFTAGGDVEAGKLEITGTGKGSFHIGVVSLMPADNVKGFRKDIVDVLKQLHSGIYRWPGGNMTADYDWRDGIGDRDKRAPRYEYAWKTVEYNDVGLSEFMDLTKLLGIDPYICVNAGLGDAYSAAQEVQYCNGAVTTPMGKLRAAYGHPAPYKINLWGIGNEMYGEWQIGHMSIEHYSIKHNMFAEAMRAQDPTIKLVASGATLFETNTTARHHRKPLPAKIPYAYGSPEDWSGNLLKNSSDYFDYLAEHVYPVFTQAFNVDSQAFVNSNDPLIDRVRRVPNRIKGMAEAWDVYLKRMPEIKDKHIKFALDEWAVGGQPAERMLGAAEGLNEIFRHSDIIYMCNFTAATANVAFNQTDATLSNIGELFKLYHDHFGTIPVQVTGNSPQHEVKGTVGVDKPAVSSGSDTYPLDVVAALSADKKKLTVAIVNPTETDKQIDLNFTGMQLGNTVSYWSIIPPNTAAQNRAGQAPVVTVTPGQITGVPKSFKAAPLSVSIYEFMVN